jgi:hypothetical protein
MFHDTTHIGTRRENSNPAASAKGDTGLAALRRRIARALVAGSFLSLAAGWPAAAETQRPPRAKPAPRELTVVNTSRRPVYQLRVSPSDAEQWGEDRLGESTIPPGGSFRVQLGRSADCQFDVQVIYDNVGQEERRAVNICRTKSISFDGSTIVLPPDPFATARTVAIANRAGRAIHQLFISSPSAEQWGDDLAPSRGIVPGQTGEITYRGGCTVDLRLVYDNRAAEERRNLDLCKTAGLLVRPGWTTDEDVHPAPPPGLDDLTLLNRTGQTITELYLRPEADGEDAEADLLGNDVLPAGGRIIVPFRRGAACRFVARILHGGDRGTTEQRGIDLCRNPMITLDRAKIPG